MGSPSGPEGCYGESKLDFQGGSGRAVLLGKVGVGEAGTCFMPD